MAPNSVRRGLAVIATALGGTAAAVGAQCPDGSAPPCPSARVAAAPRLDDRTWIVLPFDNVARAADIEWLKDGSVNLLYLDMSKWRDIRVIDDERVADLVRQVARDSRLSLESGMAVARRAGAGRLVMGDLVKLGTKMQLVGKVFDVRNGQRMRTVQAEAANGDSIMSAFGQLARRVLGVDPPAGTNLGAVGTNSVEAYKSYVAGIGYMNRWMLDSAHAQFARALQLDSTFALAHYKLSIVYGWESPGDKAGATHADAALRLGTNLPPRERQLVTGNVAFKNGKYAEACAVFERMIAADSTDVEAWYNLGECSFHDIAVLPVAGDSTRFAFRASQNTAVRAFRRTLDLDPTYHLAFQHILDVGLATQRTGCRQRPNADPCADLKDAFQAQRRRSGDSLVTIPISVMDGAGISREQELARREHARSGNLRQALAAASAWLSSAPTENRARVAHGRIHLRLGMLNEADSVFRTIASDVGMTGPEAGAFYLDRLELALKLGDGAAARRYDERIVQIVARAPPSARFNSVLVSAALGNTMAVGPAVESHVQGPPWVKQYFSLQAQAALGLTVDSLFESERVFAANVARSQAMRASLLVAGSLCFVDPRVRAGRWPITDTASTDRRVLVASFLALGDTTRFKRELARMDSVLTDSEDEPDQGASLTSSLFHLAVGDTAGALTSLRAFRDQRWKHSSFTDQIGAGVVQVGMTWPRTILLLGDLAAATGQRDEAARAYRHFISLWEQGDAAAQPFVQRAREALAKLSP